MHRIAQDTEQPEFETGLGRTESRMVRLDLGINSAEIGRNSPPQRRWSKAPPNYCVTCGPVPKASARFLRMQEA